MDATTCSESDRLSALYALNILDTAPEAHFEAVCRTAKRLFGTAHAVITLIDADRQWRKSEFGPAPREEARSTTFCDHTIRSDAVLVVPDTREDPRFETFAIVGSPQNIRFYAGAPLIVRPGLRVGALCLLDTKPRVFSEEDAAALRDLAMVVVAHLRLGETNVRLNREVAAREQSENALKDTTDLFHLALDSAKAGAWEWDMRSGTVTLARESVAIYGLPGQGECRLSTAEWTQLLNPEDREPTWQAVRNAVESGKAYGADFRVKCGDASERWMRASGRVFYDADDRPYRMVGLHFDVTERKRAEAALEAATVAAETARLEAEHANAAKSEFLATMSHEIRTPLNSILGYAELLLESDQLQARDRRYLELVQSSGLALLTVVNDVLDFSKIEAGQLELDPTLFSLSGAIDNAVSIAAGTSLKRSLTISCELDPALPAYVTGDEGRLKQVLLNLLNNSVKFTPAGSVTLRVMHEGSGGRVDGGSTDALRFEVVDTGIGIAPSQRERLFKQFSQVDGSISRRFGGSGLGLAICQRLVTMMGGAIGVESQLGAGSTFWFTLEFERSQTLPIAANAPERTASPAQRAKRLLLVEDVEINQELARVILEARGYDVDVVDSGVGAVAAIEAQARTADAYDLVLMDVQMPAMDGLTATRRLRALGEPTASVPIIAMTANVLPDQIGALRAAGMDDHVGKPFKRAELYGTIERWIGRRSTSTPDGRIFERCDAA